MARISTSNLVLMAALAAALLLVANACPAYPVGQRCEAGHFLGPQWVFSGFTLTNITLGNDGAIQKWSTPACCSVCQAYVDSAGNKDCTAFTVVIAADGNAVCVLKSKGIPDGQQCPAGSTCISGIL